MNILLLFLFFCHAKFTLGKGSIIVLLLCICIKIFLTLQGICPGNRLRIVPGCYDSEKGLASLSSLTGQNRIQRSVSSVHQQHNSRNNQSKKVIFTYLDNLFRVFFKLEYRSWPQNILCD